MFTVIELELNMKFETVTVVVEAAKLNGNKRLRMKM
jgi:uncharacterized protein YqgV (UPF0045/DUF77 family)